MVVASTQFLILTSYLMHMNSVVSLSDNVTAGRAGAIYSEDNSAISYKGNSSETFVHNNAEYTLLLTT